MKIPMIPNDLSYGTERGYNALRLPLAPAPKGARGLKDDEPVGAGRRGNMDELADHGLAADRVLVF